MIMCFFAKSSTMNEARYEGLQENVDAFFTQR